MSREPFLYVRTNLNTMFKPDPSFKTTGSRNNVNFSIAQKHKSHFRILGAGIQIPDHTLLNFELRENIEQYNTQILFILFYQIHV